jgi:hypothetical protein
MRVLLRALPTLALLASGASADAQTTGASRGTLSVRVADSTSGLA